MSISTFTVADDLRAYFLSVSLREHPALTDCRERTSRMSTAGMQISPEQGQFMQFIIRLLGAKRVLEVGVFTGYSSTAMALALPLDGELVGIDTNKSWTDLAARTWLEAGVSDKIRLILQNANEALEDLFGGGFDNYFDLAFIDADKKNYGLYYEQCLALIRPGGVIIIDNAFMGGQVIDAAYDDDPNVAAVKALNEQLLRDDRVEVSLIPLGDGVYLVWKK